MSTVTICRLFNYAIYHVRSERSVIKDGGNVPLKKKLVPPTRPHGVTSQKKSKSSYL